MDQSILLFFAKFIESELGIVYKEVNFFQLETRLQEICKVFNYADVNTLYKQCVAEGIKGTLKQYLLDLATNNETSFFRDPKLWAALKSKIFPDQIEKNKGAPVKIWSMACSSGQEIYSIAMTLDQIKEEKKIDFNYSILATDISDRILERAKAGQFSQLEVQRGLPITTLMKYFSKNAQDNYDIIPKLRSNLTFKKVNLLNLKNQTDVTGQFDIIFIRNVLIYQNDQRKREILAEISKYIKSGGVLILGAAESLIGLSQDFNQLIHEGVVYYQKK